MKSLTTSLLLFVGATGVASAAGHPTFADSIRHIDSVLITARARQEISINPLGVPERKVPMTINKVSGVTLQQRAITQLGDALRFTPAVQNRKTYGAFNEIAVRGFNRAVYMVDGVRDERSMVNSNPFINLYNVERIEVLKGPASVLYGYANAGGIINVVRRAPSDSLTLGAHLRYGSLGYYDLGVHAGGQLARGLNIYAGGFHAGGDQWRHTQDTQNSLFTALSYTKGAHSFVLRLEGFYDYFGTETGLPALMPADMYRVSDDQLFARKDELRPGLDRSWRYNDQSDFMYHSGANASLKWTYNFGSGWRLSDYLSGSYDDIDYFSTETMSWPTSPTAGAKYGYYSKAADGTKTYYDLDHLIYDSNLRFSHITQIMQNTLDLTGSFALGSIVNNLRLGYSTTYMHRTSYSGYNDDDIWGPSRSIDAAGEVVYPQGRVLNPDFNGGLMSKFSQASPNRTWVHGFSLSDVVELTPQLKAMLALRYDLYSYKSTKSRVATINGERRHDTVKDDQWLSVSPQELSYRGGLVWLPTESLSFYGSIGSFFAPDQTLSLNPATERFYDKDGQAVTERRNGYYFEPRRGYQAELGAKYTLGELLDLSLSGYFIRQQNEVVRTTQTEQVGGATKRYSVSAQIGATESKGFEAEATLRPATGLSLSAGYGYTDAAIAEVNETPVSKLFNIKKGTPLAWVPKHTLYTYGGYELQRGALRGLGLNYSLTYRSEMYYNVGAGRTFDPTTQLDLGASYRLPYGISLELQVRNVLGTKSWASTLGTQLIPAEPTNALVTLRYQL